MGVPMTRFSMLSKIIQRNSLDRSKVNGQSFLQQFNLYAIVLCRPDDRSFIDYMSLNFENLDDWT